MHRFVFQMPFVVVLTGLLAVGVPGIVVAQDARPATATAEPPDTPVGEALAWVLTVLNDGAASLTPDQMTARFAPTFLEAIPPEIIVGLVQQVSADAPFTFEGFTRPPTTNQVNALLIGHSGTPLVMPLSVEPAAPHRITGVNLAPAPLPPDVQPQHAACRASGRTWVGQQQRRRPQPTGSARRRKDGGKNGPGGIKILWRFLPDCGAARASR